MTRVFINAVNVTSEGSRSLAINLLPPLVNGSEFRFTLLFPDDCVYRSMPLRNDVRMTYYSISSGVWNNLSRLKQVYWDIPRLVDLARSDVCLTLGDLGPIRLSCPHVIFLHQALFVYDQHELAGLGAWAPAKRLFLLRHFRSTANRAAGAIVQTPVMADRFSRKYDFDKERIAIIPLPAPGHVNRAAADTPLHPQIAACDKPVKLFFLAAFYPHKNHQILPAVAQELHSRGMADRVHIFTTLADMPRSKRIRARLAQFPRIVTNLGVLRRSEVVGALRASTALFLPTLVESYGLVYLEAMACGRPILTSDRDFARWMCRDLAIYFDPLSPASIVDSIQALAEFTASGTYSRLASRRLAEFPGDWSEVASQFAASLQRIV